MECLEGRNVVTRSPHRRVGYVNCRWLQSKNVQYESLLERDCARLLLLCPNLIEITSQPFKIPLGDGAYYTPDFLLRFPGSHSVVVEVKHTSFLKKDFPRLLKAKVVLEEMGLDYLVLTEREIQHADRSGRAGSILRYGRGQGLSESVDDLLPQLATVALSMGLEEWSRMLGTSETRVLTLVAMRQLAHVDGRLVGPIATRRFFLERPYAANQTRAWIGAADLW
ncbi:Tn7 transposase TnsA N-terminal domain-containing protein [Achromobacter aegrifaciens]